MKTTLLWFRNDLRLHDHPALSRIGRDRLLPMYVFPPRIFGKTSFGFAKVGPFRGRFLTESVRELRRRLEDLNSGLLVAAGEPATIIKALVDAYDVEELWYQEEVGTEEAAEVETVVNALTAVQGGRRANVLLHPYSGQTLYHPDDLPFLPEGMPDVFTDFRKAVEKRATVRPARPAPKQLPPLPASLPSIESHLSKLGISCNLPSVDALSGAPEPPQDERSAFAFGGGERAALQRVEDYFWTRDSLRRYRRTRNGLLGTNYSSKFSAWLANGSLSPRLIYEEVRRYEEQRVRNDSTYWMIFELIWRDYFSFLARKYPRRIFDIKGPMRREFPWKNDLPNFRRWQEGRTGQPFIDANMLELGKTGYMSNRGRQNVASYLARDLGVNWLMGAEYFESLLVDYDPASNYGNWTYTVGVGTDPRRDRYFDPVKQAAKYDPSGRFQRQWLEGR